jgi:hypothetical protein
MGFWIARPAGRSFGVAPEWMWPQIMQSLLPFERMIAGSQHDVGCTHSYKFKTRMRAHSTKFMHKAIPYKRAEREWITNEVNRLCETGVMEKVDHVDCASNIVLVKQGQSG